MEGGYSAKESSMTDAFGVTVNPSGVVGQDRVYNQPSPVRAAVPPPTGANGPTDAFDVQFSLATYMLVTAHLIPRLSVSSWFPGLRSICIR